MTRIDKYGFAVNRIQEGFSAVNKRVEQWRSVIPFVKDGKEQTKLRKMPASLRQEAEIYLYKIGKQMLEAYGCYEVE